MNKDSMEIDFELLKQISETPGAPGHEKPIRNLVISRIEKLVDAYYTDPMGNLIAVKKGSNNPDSKKVMLASHLDEIGFMVNHIDDNGFLRFIPLGGFDPKTLTSMRVNVHGKETLPGVMGSKPIHIIPKEERGKLLKIEDFYIDLGLPKAEVEKVVEVGAAVTRFQELGKLGKLISGKSLDNRASIYILVDLLQRLKEIPYDLYAVFTVQEEVGIRGAMTATHHINPNFAIALDVTIAADTPGISAEKQITKIGKGAAIKAYDAGTICDHRMVAFLKKMAAKSAVRWQTEILPYGGTDASAMQKMGKNGAITGALSTPARYLHQTIETVHPADMSASVALLKTALEHINDYDWAH